MTEAELHARVASLEATLFKVAKELSDSLSREVAMTKWLEEGEAYFKDCPPTFWLGYKIGKWVASAPVGGA